MSKLSPIKARKLIKILLLLGFIQIRSKGSHFFFTHADGRTTVVPVHPSKEIGIGLIRAILHDIQLSLEQFNNLLKK